MAATLPSSLALRPPDESVAPRPRPPWARDDGAPRPLGATWIEAERAWNFALYSKHAEQVTLLLYGEADVEHPLRQVTLDHLRNKSGRVWHCRLPDDACAGARYWAWSVDGPPPAGREDWHAFDPAKVLLDPYATAVHFPPGFDPAAAKGPGANAGRAPLGILRRRTRDDRRAADEAPTRPRAPRHEADAVIYELHVRNFTRHPSSGVAQARRGTFAGVIDRIPWLRELGVTIVELMPVFQYDPRAADRWGYMPLAFFALHGDYASDPDADGGEAEFREMVDALHALGIEVVLDVVYNHTCERGATGPTYSFKGIDNSTYYLCSGDPAAPWADYSSTGNTLNCANQAVRKLILDSMRHWVRLGVDGFRFDLASIWARGPDGALRTDEPPIFGEIAADPEFARVRLIAEPWDANAFLLGRDFPGLSWLQWNGMFRDDVRRFVRGDPGLVPGVMRRVYGSDDLFPDDRMHADHPWQSVNYVTCHDGPTLYDLVAYDHKHNWANGYDNHDGPAHAWSWNCGWEGDERVPDEVATLRRRQARNLLLLTLLANGTPMLRAGDEFLHTQRGNDNPHNQDDETVWLDWGRAREFGDVVRFVRLAIAFRKAHPSLCRAHFWRDDVRWYGAGPLPDTSPESRAVAWCLHGDRERDDDIYVMINAGQEGVIMEVQEGPATTWRRVIDTSRPSPDDFRAPGDEEPLASASVLVAPRSIVVLVRGESERRTVQLVSG